MVEIPDLDFWDLVINVLHFPTKTTQGNQLLTNQTKLHTTRDDLELVNADYVSTNAQSCQ